MWSHKGLGMSLYSKEIDVNEKRSKNKEGRHTKVLGSKDDLVGRGTYEVHDKWYLVCDRSGLEFNRRTCVEDKGRDIVRESCYDRWGRNV